MLSPLQRWNCYNLEGRIMPDSESEQASHHSEVFKTLVGFFTFNYNLKIA